ETCFAEEPTMRIRERK
nr:serum albumin=alloalbumin {Venezia variant} [human, Peptide Partial Mutant, 16 aa] [Homo sapiens]